MVFCQKYIIVTGLLGQTSWLANLNDDLRRHRAKSLNRVYVIKENLFVYNVITCTYIHAYGKSLTSDITVWVEISALG